MYTRCPKCKTTYRVNVGQLREGHGELRCGRCDAVFDALASLAATVKDSETSPDTDRPSAAPGLGEGDAIVVPKFQRDLVQELDRVGFSRASEVPERSLSERSGKLGWESLSPWLKGFRGGGVTLALVGLLVAQAYGFEFERLSRDPRNRPWLVKLCGIVRCQLPDYRDPSQIQILDRTLNMAGGKRGGFEFSVVFANHAAFPQAFPKVKLTLNGLNGSPVAERVFDPVEYLVEWQAGMVMSVGTPFEVRLSVARPSRDVGGFAIEFL
jgi:predicted Zn finger-like uncharacterized protein